MGGRGEKMSRIKSRKEKEMKTNEEEIPEGEKAAAEQLLKAEVEALAEGFKEAVAKSQEAVAPKGDAQLGAEALLEALGMGDTEPEDKLLKQVTWELERVLHKLGFNVNKLVREALTAMTTKACWGAKFCLKYYDFLTQLAKYANDFWFMIDESWFYAGEGEKKGIVFATAAHPKERHLQTVRPR